MTQRAKRRRCALALLNVLVLIAGSETTSSAAASGRYGTSSPARSESLRVATADEEVRSWALSPASSGDVATRDEFTYESDPGTSIEDAVTLYNLGNVQLTFRVYAADGYTTDDGSFSVRPGSEEPVDAGAWVTLAQELVTVPAGQQVTIPMSVAVPADATPGDHAAGIVATVYEDRTPNIGQPVDVEFRTGTRMYLRVSGEATSSLAIGSVGVSFGAGRNPFDGVANVTFRLLNQGNTRLGGTATVTVRGLLGLGTTTVTIPDITEILPGNQVSVTSRLDGVPAVGVLTATVNVEPSGVGGTTEAPAISGSASTLAVPWGLLVLVAALVLALFGSRALRRQRLANEAVNDACHLRPS